MTITLLHSIPDLILGAFLGFILGFILCLTYILREKPEANKEKHRTQEKLNRALEIAKKFEAEVDMQPHTRDDLLKEITELEK